MYKIIKNSLNSLSGVAQDLVTIWENIVLAHSDKGNIDLKNLKNTKLTAEELDPYFFRAVDSYKSGKSADDLFKFMDYIWAWSSGYEFSNNDSDKIGNFSDPEKFNFAFADKQNNSPSYLVWISFTMNNNGFIDKASNWLNHREAFNDRATVKKTPVIASISVARLSDATPFIIQGSKLIDGWEGKKITKHTNSFGENISYQSNWDWDSKGKLDAFTIKEVSDERYGLIANCKFLLENCMTANDTLGILWVNYGVMHFGLGLLGETVYDDYAANTSLCKGIRAINYDCYSKEYLYYKYSAVPLKLRDEPNKEKLTNRHIAPALIPETIGIYQVPSKELYWSADGLFFCHWVDKITDNNITTGGEMPEEKIKCPTVKCYTEVTDKKLYFNRVKVNSDDIPFTVTQRITTCKPKGAEPIYKYSCLDNQIDEKINRLLANIGVATDSQIVTHL